MGSRSRLRFGAFGPFVEASEMARRRNWVHGWAPSDHGIDSDLPPELLVLQTGLSRDPAIAKVWLGPEGPGRHKYIDKCCG